jgi:hypothetical protein
MVPGRSAADSEAGRSAVRRTRSRYRSSTLAGGTGKLTQREEFEMTGAISRVVSGSGRRLAAGLIAVVAAVFTVAIPATAAHADVLDMYVAAHVCKDIGHNSSGEHAILCSDLAFEPINGGVRFYEVTEAYCQNAAGYVECLDNVVYNGLYSVGAPNVTSYNQGCGPSREIICVSGRMFYFANHYDMAFGTRWEIWGITFGTSTLQSSIDRPGGRVKLGGNLEVGHLIVNVPFPTQSAAQAKVKVNGNTGTGYYDADMPIPPQ